MRYYYYYYYYCCCYCFVIVIIIIIIIIIIISRDSSVVTALGYRLDDRDSRDRFPEEAGNFSFHHSVQNGSGAHPASYSMHTRVSFPGGKSGWGVKLTTHIHLVPRSKNAWSYTSTPIRLHGVKPS
jgi:hypothetical protein